ncbi:uncharacterized protein LOC123557788 isoform X2 [Mercenaria mercenaria]|uniref:uncharacterized protein LOC123557788 isoform X2 n=1 Tax=Mercenaria mercenaria TaxID=6596 RepID=UPI00234F9136|nr:uncharacterized protein LOC123557788 isoform X2 [Mercenaria mercenaria]XP_053400126.1 uncharacterized protein LOC123557788 isoform X2 [Mercenaria mercenaria]
MSGQGTKACILDCPICTNIFEDPRILPCQHTTCEKCLSSYIKDIIQKDGKRPTEFPCPVCRRKTKLREASSFQKNLTIVALLDFKSLSAKLRKASAKKKTKAVTTETQTSREETFPDPNNVPAAISKAFTPEKEKNTKGHYKQGNKATDTVNRQNDKRVKMVNPTENNDHKVNLTVTLINCTFLENISDIYLLFVFNLVFIAMAYYMPVLITLIITHDLFCNYSQRSFLLDHLCLKQIIKAKKWWYVFLLTYVEWAQSTLINLLWLILFALIFSLFFTFYGAISNKQSVFTFDAVMENFILRLITLGYAAYNLNLELVDMASSIFHWLF